VWPCRRASGEFLALEERAFDKITDEMFAVDPNDKARMLPLFRQAMEIWIPELPDVQLVQKLPPHSLEHHLLEELADPG